MKVFMTLKGLEEENRRCNCIQKASSSISVYLTGRINVQETKRSNISTTGSDTKQIRVMGHRERKIILNILKP